MFRLDAALVLRGRLTGEDVLLERRGEWPSKVIKAKRESKIDLLEEMAVTIPFNLIEFSKAQEAGSKSEKELQPFGRMQ